MAKLLELRTVETDEGQSFELAVDPEAVAFVMKMKVAAGPDRREVGAVMLLVKNYPNPIVIEDEAGTLIQRINEQRS
jgi:hypothetical protein